MDVNQHQSVSILYDLAMAMAGETRPRPLATVMLQQMLLHTGCACGAIVIGGVGPSAAEPRIYAAVGNRALRALEGHPVPWDPGRLGVEAAESATGWFAGGVQHTHALPLVLPAFGAIILFSPKADIIGEASRRARILLPPILAKFARTLQLCLDNEYQRTALEDARDAAEAANRAKSAFLANMSHELRTPMNAIIGLTHLLTDEIEEPNTRSQVLKVNEAAHHLLQILNDVLDLSKIEAGRLTIDTIEFSPARVLDHAVTLLAERATAKGLELVRDVAPDVPGRLVGDPLRLGQVLVNFIANAIKFSEKGRVTVRIVVASREDDQVVLRIEVEDQGIGLTPEQQARLFQPFVQADESTTRQFGGTGLGLVICQRIATLMGGQVGVISAAGAGSTFWMTAKAVAIKDAPLAAPEPVPEEKPDVRLARLCGGTRILLVEDNPVNQKVALAVLKRAALDVDVASDGAQAVERVRDGDYALVLMDVQMPVLDGMSATRQIRQLPNRASLPIIAMTANAFEEDRRACLEAGMSDFIGKPVVPSTLYKGLLAWLAPGADADKGQADGPARPLIPADSLRLQQLLAQIETLLTEGDMRVVSVWDESAGLIIGALGSAAVPVRQEIGAFRFDRALQQLRALRSGLSSPALAASSVSGQH
ncbi:MAG: ATP-binding protein [Vicinamibacterales bacterium]